ncbi:cellulase family glycosylhydrolase [Paenibacillus whitsoniae]|nr:cellulase family glycosylhydrolase [Paenibacillus whitsoniae]
MFLRKMGIFLMICLAGIIGLPLNQANAIDSDYFGVNDPLQRYTTDYTTEINQIADSQIQWIRISPEWGRIETAKGVYDTAYLNQLDNMVNQLTAKGIHIVWILCYTAPWASSMPGAPSPDIARYKPANWVDWESYVNFITTRYQGKIQYWEVWNEQDSLGFWKSSIDDYNTLLQKAYTGVKATDSSNTVLLGGLALSS